MVVQPTQFTDTESTTEDAAAATLVREDDLSSIALAGSAEAKEVSSSAPVAGPMHRLHILDADTAVVVQPDGEVPAELAPDEAVLIEAASLVPETESVDELLTSTANSVAEAHSHAAPPALTQAGDVIDLLSGTEALQAVDNLAPFELSAGDDRDSVDFLQAGSVPAPAVAASPAPVGQASDLIFLDVAPFAKPDNPGGGGGNGGGNGGGKGGKNGGDDTVDADPGDPDVLSDYLSGDAGGYNILIEFEGDDWTVDLQDAFIWAADWISSVVTGDIQDVFYRGDVIDDLLISAELTYIDGTFGILGQAGPTAVRSDGYLPATGIMEFDVADADYFNSLGLWDDIVVHEMLHTVGFGTIWDYLGLVEGSGTSDPTFTGTQAMLAFADLLQSDDPLAVPLEEDGGAGTAESHWDEETFDNEIMTGYIDGSNEMTDLTVASLSDLGYDTVDWTGFTEFTV